jgi:RNA-binding protein
MNHTDLTPAQRRNLRSHAHHLHPLVMIGNEGLTDAVLKAVDIELKHHELIKVRVFGDDRGEREALLDAICKTLACEAVQHIGKLFVLYRAAPGGGAVNPDIAYGEALAARQRTVIAPAGAHLTKKQAAAGKKPAKKAAREEQSTTRLDKKAVQKLTRTARTSTRSASRTRNDADLPAPRAGKYDPVPGTSSTRRTHLSAAERRAAYATVTERAPRPTTKPERASKPRKSAAKTGASTGYSTSGFSTATTRRAGGRKK